MKHGRGLWHAKLEPDKIIFFLGAMTSENKEDYFDIPDFVMNSMPQSSIFAERKRCPSRAAAMASAG
jgi:hypothetical protein